MYLRVKPNGQKSWQLRYKNQAPTNGAGLAWAATWRKLLRESDGVLTKDIRNFKRQELDSCELALEYVCLAGELQPAMDLWQMDTYEARERYLSSRETAFALYGDHCLTTSATALFALPEAEAFLKSLQRKKLII